MQASLKNFLSNHPNPLTHGKTAATSTVSNWIKKGKERADTQTVSRVTGNASGRGSAFGSVPEVDRVWFKLMEFWNEYLKEKPPTDRYTLSLVHLRGKVELKKDDLLYCHAAGRKRWLGIQ